MTLLKMKIGGPFYIGALVFLVLISIFLVWYGRKKSMKWRHRFVGILLWFNFALHFLKMLIPSYIEEIPFSLSRMSPENYCALFVLVAPFIYEWGGKYLKDYLYFIGFFSGIVAMIGASNPAKVILISEDNIVNISGFLEVGRYYVCHIIITVSAILLVAYGLHKLDYRRLWALPISFTVAGLICFADAMLFGYVFHCPGWPSDWATFNDRSAFTNQSMAFGPGASLDPYLGWLYKIMIPGLQTYYYGDQLYFTPVLWTFPPVVLATLIAGPIMCGPAEWRHMKNDHLIAKQRRANRRGA